MFGLTGRLTSTLWSFMKQLGPHKKYVIAAAVIQSIIVVIAGYLLFKSKFNHDPADSVQKKPHVEQTATKTN